MNDAAYLIIHKDFPVSVNGVNSGAEMATLGEAYALAKLGRRVIVAAELKDGEQTKNGVEFWDIGNSYNVGQIIERARHLGPYHLISAGRIAAIQESRGETSCLSRSLIIHDPSAAALGVRAEIATRIVDNVICVSEAQRGLFLQEKADPAKVKVVYNGADPEYFTAGDSDKRDYNRIIFVGALVADKGIIQLINTFAKLKAVLPNLKLDVYGSASMWAREELINTAEIESQLPGIKFHGKVSQETVVEAYRGAGMCVISSIWFDSFPLTAVEAQVTGCPVVGFSSGGIREAVISGETGLLAEEVSEAGLYKAMHSLLASPEKLRQMSKNALTIQRPKFTWENTAKSIIKLCEKADPNEQRQSGLVEKKIGILTTWKQACGLATYAGYMCSQFPSNSFVVLAEEATTKAADEDFVERCWSKNSGDYSRLLTAIEKHDIGLLQLNCHYRFFQYPQFNGFLEEVRKRGIKVVTLIHNPYTVDPSLQQLAINSDVVMVHTTQNRLEMMANKIQPNKVVVLPHGVSVRKNIDKHLLRKRYGINDAVKVLTCFGFTQAHKGMEGLLESVHYLRARGHNVLGLIVGGPLESDPSSKEYLQGLQELSRQLKIESFVKFVSGFVSDEQVGDYLALSDVVLMNYRSSYYEASGACSLAIGAGALVAASVAPPFQVFEDAVWHITSGFPPQLSVEVLLDNQELSASILQRARKYCEQNSWTAIYQRLTDIYRNLGIKITTADKEKAVELNNKNATTGGQIKVLMQNRPTANSHRGGDTVLMENLAAGLRKRGITVEIDLEGRKDPKNFDLVHLFNFATPDYTRALAERAHAAGVPFVVTTLCEDLPTFHEQSRALANCLIDYTRAGQSAQWWQQNKTDITRIKSAPPFNNQWVAANAAMLFSNGANESQVVLRDYPNAKVREIKLGHEFAPAASPELFSRQYGIKDYVLCVGRIESRKNQLMLLKALENSDLPVVLAAGGFSYQPEYEKAVRQFKRRGQTLILDRQTPEMLASCYAAARCHALPSWYELPGLVSLEAAFYGCNIVGTKTGTTFDYLGDKAYYCQPQDENSIFVATTAAYYSPKTIGLKELVAQYSWDKTADETLEAYRQIVKTVQQVTTVTTRKTMNTNQIYDFNPSATEFQELLEKGELKANEGQYSEAIAMLERARCLNSASARLERGIAAIHLAESRVKEARQQFERALAINPNDEKTLTGLGMCELLDNKLASASDFLFRALRINPMLLTALHQFIQCSYSLGKFGELEEVLRRYLQTKPEDREIQFCLAGCLFKQSRISESRTMVEQILKAQPDHRGAIELSRLFANSNQSGVSASSQSISEATTARATPPQQAFSPQPIKTSVVTYDLDTLEDSKRRREYNDVKLGANAIVSGGHYNAQQKEHAKLLLAEVAAVEGDSNKASAIYAEVLAANARCTRAICGRGALAASQNRQNEAEQAFKQALEINKREDLALTGLGFLRAFAGDSSGAWDFYTQALAINQENTRALLGVIELGYKLGRLKETEGHIRNYLELHPADLNFLYSLAGCCFAQDKLEEATLEIEKISIFDNEHKLANELKGLITQKRQGGSNLAASNVGGVRT